MALIFADGFEHYGTGSGGRTNMLKGAWAAIDNFSPSATHPRTGANSFNNPSTGEARVSLGGVKSVIGVAAGLYLNILPDSNVKVGFSLRTQANIDIASIVIASDGALILKTGGLTGTSIAISDSVFTAGTAHHIEAKFVVDPVVGSCEIHFNGVEILNIANINLGANPVGSVALVQGSSATPVIASWDDFILWDDNGDFNNDFIGPMRVLTVFATGDVSGGDWSTTGSANAFECIDEVPPDGDTSFIGADTVGDKVAFTMPTLPPETVAIAGVFIPVMGRIDDAGIGHIRLSAISDAEETLGNDINLTPGYSYFRTAFEYDPATEAAWTKTGFEAAEIAIEKTL